jgi:hypothetical protein
MVATDDGSHPRPPSRLHSPVLRRHARRVAADCFERIYATWPELDERYGERGRQYTAEDNFWHLDYLDEAVAAKQPEIFADYADWLTGLMLARGLVREHIAGAFGFLAEAIEQAECAPSRSEHRRELVNLLRGNQARVLGGSPLDNRNPSAER